MTVDQMFEMKKSSCHLCPKKNNEISSLQKHQSYVHPVLVQR